MKIYVGTKVIQAEPMDECSFLAEIKEQDVTNSIWINNSRDTRPGYKVIYPDGYVSWSPKETFETAYREITDSELGLIGS